MESRRSNGKKWTPIPADFTKQVINAMRDSFKDETKSGKFIFEGRIYPDELVIRVGFIEKGRLRQTNFDISVDYKPGRDDTYKLLGVAVDVGATMLDELFASVDDGDFPRLWQVYEVEGRKVHLQFSTENSELDREADKLLGSSTDGLVNEDEEDEAQKELDAIRAKLGIDEGEDLPDEEEPPPKKKQH